MGGAGPESTLFGDEYNAPTRDIFILAGYYYDFIVPRALQVFDLN
ncbi:MAG TPA: hypothetical protein VGB30_01715 [bacterium]